MSILVASLAARTRTTFQPKFAGRRHFIQFCCYEHFRIKQQDKFLWFQPIVINNYYFTINSFKLPIEKINLAKIVS